ncbi:hypothetical protein [Acidiplasma sp. MBA-1]|uniref:hypothetical protein n=1 Tax=Acidiplasma sp. MBA-1 TaxID=1293648 RepID=UPI0005E58E38|nr:hypothetical protein [Acidiplasma sp. MBA-1]KJE49298.1 hypothetical protein TZ01_04395 [Acidiplasma sp. MBA-1]
MKKCDKCGRIIRVGFESYVNFYSDGLMSYHYNCFRDMILESARRENKRSKIYNNSNVNLDNFQEALKYE